MVAAKTGKAIRVEDKEAAQAAVYDARAFFAKSEKTFADAEINGERARTLREWARYEIKSGERDLGGKMWQEAREIFAKLGAQREVARMNEMPE